ncbi:MAG: hypothetical protein RLY87_2009, partial [Chloroflexota bacterium]
RFVRRVTGTISPIAPRHAVGLWVITACLGLWVNTVCRGAIGRSSSRIRSRGIRFNIPSYAVQALFGPDHMCPTPRVPYRGQSKTQLSVCNISHRRFERTYHCRNRTCNRFSKCFGSPIVELHRRPQNSMDVIRHNNKDIRQYVCEMHWNTEPGLRHQRTQPIEFRPTSQYLTK